MKKKGQVAFDNLMTWGWVLLILAGMLVALNYYGVVNIKQYLPGKCEFSPGIGCLRQQISTEATSPSGLAEIGIVLVNKMSDDIWLHHMPTIFDAIDFHEIDCDPAPLLWFGNRIGNYPIEGGVDGAAITNISGNHTVLWPKDAVRELRIFCRNDIDKHSRPHIDITLEYSIVGSDYKRTIHGQMSDRVN